MHQKMVVNSKSIWSAGRTRNGYCWYGNNQRRDAQEESWRDHSVDFTSQSLVSIVFWAVANILDEGSKRFAVSDCIIYAIKEMLRNNRWSNVTLYRISALINSIWSRLHPDCIKFKQKQRQGQSQPGCLRLVSARGEVLSLFQADCAR